MGKIIYTVLTSADGYFEDAAGNFDWARPDEDVHRYINNSERMSSLLLFGRKMYEVMKIWEDFPDLQNMPDYIIEYAGIWKIAKKVVYSSSLKTVETADTILKRAIDKNELEEMILSENGNIGIGGAELASQVLALKLVDEIHLYTFPVIIGSGKKWINAGEKTELEEYECREFENGVVLTKYKVK
ncbi:MAG TPA: deaminase [Treponema sp.]|nr:MAG: hypothetical protein A2Y36_10885 [Treponema sp. GWA1_62_8]OHE67966.1 MAG: hypothetical protein A2413_06970 [Treponema sp. RIFOXYC1_FULL_61_9]HCM26893.1 deaminase [Treponema sp.]